MSDKCQHIQNLFFDGGALSAEHTREIETHVSNCESCRALWLASQEIDQAFSQLGDVEVPEQLVSKVFQEQVFQQLDSSQDVTTEKGGFMASNRQSNAAKRDNEEWNNKEVAEAALAAAQRRRFQRMMFGAGTSIAMIALLVTFAGRHGEVGPLWDSLYLGQKAETAFHNVGSAISTGELEAPKSPSGPAVLEPLSGEHSGEKETITVGTFGFEGNPTSQVVRSNSKTDMTDQVEAYRDLMSSLKSDLDIVRLSVEKQESRIKAEQAARGRNSEGLFQIFAEQAPSQIAAIQPPQNAEKYGEYVENTEQLTVAQPVSTFSIDVDTGSYTNTRRFLNQNTLPPTESVRVEEFLNYFDYHYPTSAKGEPFTLNYEIAPSPLSQGKHLLKVGIQANGSQTIDADKGWNLVFLIDTSGSMYDANKLPLLKSSFKALVNRMRSQDRVAIVTYAGTAGTLLPSTSGAEKRKILDAIESLTAGGSTNGAGGITAAYEIAKQNRLNDGVNRIILATDGDFNVGITSFEGLVSLVEQERKGGITLTTLGFGAGNYNEKNLEQLANKGNGNYFYIDSEDEGRRVLDKNLVSNMEIVAKDVKLQVEFNPGVVKSYRLVGYDNRRLANQDFNNDAVDAGEIGAGHTVTALYEVTLIGSEADVNTELRYQTEKTVPPVVKPAKLDEFAFLKVRFKAPNGDTSKLLEFPMKTAQIGTSVAAASADFKFASAVAGFAQILKKSEHAGSLTLGQVRELAQSSVGDDIGGARNEFVSLVRKAEMLRNGRIAE